MTEPSKCDVAVIGAGMSGYVASIRLAQLGKKVTLIESGKLGGTCVNLGCIPMKSLLAIADLVTMAKRAKEFEVLLGDFKTDFSKVIARKDAVVSRLIEGVKFLIKKNGIHLVQGNAKIQSRNQIKVLKPDGNEEIISTDNIIIATGSDEPKPPYAQMGEDKVLTTKGALEMKEAPKSLVVIGGNIIGIEFAVFFNSFDTEVRILESSSRLLPNLDADIGRTYQRILKKKNIEIYLDAELNSVHVKPDGKVGIGINVKESQIGLETEKVLVANTRRPLTHNLGLENIGLQTKDGFIIVDEHMRTNINNIYAVGDVTGGRMLAHVASTEGIIAAMNIAGLGLTFNSKTIPTCMYCQPEVASVGLSEDEAKDKGYKVSVGKFPLLANGRALTLGETDGFAKIVCDAETGEILGVHLIGPHATDLISEATLAMLLECTYEEIGSLIHPHPTISEALMEAAMAVSKKAIHI